MMPLRNRIKIKNNIPTEKLYLYLSIALGVVFFVGILIYNINTNKYVEANENQYEIFITYNTFEHSEIEARSAHVFDIKGNKVLHEKMADEPLPIASITKLMTAFVASEVLPPNARVSISLESLYTEGESGFIPFEVWSNKDLVDFTLITSSNDGATALAATANSFLVSRGDEGFIEKMNSEAEDIGLKNAQFFNPTGLDVNSSRAGAYASAEDITVLMAHLLREYPQTIEATSNDTVVFTSISGLTHVARTTNKISGDIPNLIAAKTGFTDLAGGNLVIAASVEDNPVIFTVLGSSKEGRFRDVEELHRRTVRHFEYQKEYKDLEKEILAIFDGRSYTKNRP